MIKYTSWESYAILVGGDIAYKAHTAEYKAAYDWLMAHAAEPERIVVVHGNHDVDQPYARGLRSFMRRMGADIEAGT